MKYDSETSEQVLSCAFSESFKMTLFVEHYKKLFLLVDLIHEMKNLKKNPSSYRKVSLVCMNYQARHQTELCLKQI